MSKSSRLRDVLFRVLAALLVGTLVAGTAYSVAFFTTRRVHPDSFPVAMGRDLKLLSDAIKQHRQKSGKLPTTLTELEGLKELCRTDEAGRPVDDWKHPYEYRVDGDRFTLLSYGRDGQLGGEGLDADFSADRPPEPPTLRQFTYEMSTGGVQATCVLAGVCAGIVCLFPSRNHGSFVKRLLVTVAGALFVAFILSVLHSSGH